MHYSRRVLAIAIGSALAAAVPAHAFEIDTGNPDLAVRWDNTVRYNLGLRAQAQDAKILGNPNFDDGDRNFNKGSVVTNRIDLLSEFDFVFQRNYGFRTSAAVWGDAAYRGPLDNHSNATANTLVDGLPVAGALSPYTKRFSKGPSGEFLDAFVFANLDAGGVPVSVKAGQHTVFWGDSLLLGGAVHSVSYAQNALDLQKGFTTPGSEAKELFRPRGAITVQAQPTSELSVAGQWFYNWQAVRIPESGNYLTIQDGLNFGGESVVVAPNPLFPSVPGTPALLRAWNVSDTKPSRYGNIGDFGASARWSPAWLNGTLGFYARKATDILPQILLTPGLASGVPAPTCTAIGGQALPGNACIINRNATTVSDLQKFGKFGTYQTAYGDDIRIFGVSLAKEIAGMSWAAELSYRQNMPLQSNIVNVLPAPLVAGSPGSIAVGTIPDHGTPGALGDTYHGLVNVLNILPKSALYDTASIAGELTWMQWARVTQNMAAFKGNDAYTGIDKVSKNYFGLAVNFTPTWFQVMPGVDFSAPMTWSQGLSGNSAVQLGGNKGAGTWSAGVAADIYQKYRVQLSYNGYYGKYSVTPAGAMNVANGTSASLSDRGWISLTFKTTF